MEADLEVLEGRVHVRLVIVEAAAELFLASELFSAEPLSLSHEDSGLGLGLGSGSGLGLGSGSAEPLFLSAHEHTFLAQDEETERCAGSGSGSGLGLGLGLGLEPLFLPPHEETVGLEFSAALSAAELSYFPVGAGSATAADVTADVSAVGGGSQPPSELPSPNASEECEPEWLTHAGAMLSDDGGDDDGGYSGGYSDGYSVETATTAAVRTAATAEVSRLRR